MNSIPEPFRVPNDLSRCHHCGGGDGSKLKRCVRCNAAVYCGRECQKQAWPTHRVACRRVDEDEDLDERQRALVSHYGDALQAIGYPTTVSCAHAMSAWADTHSWAFDIIVKAVALLHGGPSSLDVGCETYRRIVYIIIPGAFSNGNLAKKFRIERWETPLVGKTRARNGRQRMRTLQNGVDSGALLPEDEDDTPGTVSTLYGLKGTSVTLCLQRNLPHVNARDFLLDMESERVVRDVTEACIVSINMGLPLRPIVTDGKIIACAGTMVRHKKTWTWKPLGDALTSLPPLASKPPDLFERFAQLGPRNTLPADSVASGSTI